MFQELTADWFDEMVHNGWVSTRDFAPTNEIFYFGTQKVVEDEDAAVDDLAPVGDAEAWRKALPPSQQVSRHA